MAMDKTAMKNKIKAAYLARTTNVMSEGEFQVLIDICQGIIEEIIASAVVNTTVTVTGVQTGISSASGTGVGSITS